MPRFAKTIVCLFICVPILGSCGKSVTSERQNRGNDIAAVNEDDMTAKGAGLPGYCEAISPPDPIGDGLSDLATVLENSLRLISGESALRQLCLRCQPRQLARIQCMKVELGSVNDICANNLHAITDSSSFPAVKCRAGNRSDGTVNHAVFDLKPNRIESVISILPLAALLVENQIASKFADGSRQKIIADAAIEFAKTHATGVLLGKRDDQAVDFLVGKISNFMTATGRSLDDAKTKQLRDAVGRAFDDVANLAAQSDSLTPEQLQSVTSRIYEVAPSLQKYQFILPILFTPGSADLLTQNLGSTLSPEALAALLDMFNMPTIQ